MGKTMERRDRGRPRTVEDLERKYNFGEMKQLLLETDKTLKEILQNGTGGGSNTTYELSTGDNNGQIKITASDGSAYNVAVKGLGSAAYTNSGSYAEASHRHSAATTTTDGFMTAAMVTKLNGIATGANDMTYTIATGDNNGQIKVTPSTGSAYNVAVKGLGTAAYRTIKTATAVTHTNYSADNNYVPDFCFLSYWNGAYSSNGASNLSRCSTGAIMGSNGGTFTGAVTFNSSITLKGGLELYGSTPYIDFHYGNSTADYTTRLLETNSKVLQLQGATNFIPGSQKPTLGTGSNLWGQIYSSASTIATSDLNQKRDLAKLLEDERYLQLFDEVEPYKYYFKNGDRVHTGFISQYVEQALEKVGLTAEECAFFCKDKMVEFVYDENGFCMGQRTVLDENGDPMWVYSLRYEEYIAIMAAKIKSMQKEIDRLNKRIS